MNIKIRFQFSCSFYSSKEAQPQECTLPSSVTFTSLIMTFITVNCVSIWKREVKGA